MRVFDWDDLKAKVNLAKHGVTFGEAETVFEDPLARVRFDPFHSEAEERLVIVGASAKGRLLLVSFYGPGGSHPDHQCTTFDALGNESL